MIGDVKFKMKMCVLFCSEAKEQAV